MIRDMLFFNYFGHFPDWNKIRDVEAWEIHETALKRAAMNEPKPEYKPSQDDLTKLRRELESIIIKVNYHFQSGYERHVNLQTPESIFLNFLKKITTAIPTQYLHRICKQDFQLIMKDNYVIRLSFHPHSAKHTWDNLDARLKALDSATQLIDFEEVKSKSHTLDKWYQVTDNLINSVKDFKFT